MYIKYIFFFLNISVDTDEKRSRSKRSSDSESALDTLRNGRKFCENGGGV